MVFLGKHKGGRERETVFAGTVLTIYLTDQLPTAEYQLKLSKRKKSRQEFCAV